MSITKKILSLLVFVTLISLSACKEDDGPSQLSKEDAKSKIDGFNTEASTDLKDLGDTDGLTAVKDFFDLVDTDDPFGRIGTDKKKIGAFFRARGKEFKSIFVKQKAIGGRTASEDAFNYGENLGVYTWNPQLGEAGEFEKTSESNIISLLFPTEGSSTNNAELRLTAYSEVEVWNEDNEEYTYEPSVLQATLFVNEQAVASLDLDINWDENGFPLSADITLAVSPFTASVSFDDSGSTTSTISVSLMRDQQTIIATSVTATYKDSSKSEESLKTVDGYVQFRELKLQGTIDVEASNQQNVIWSDVVKVGLYSGDDKLGDIVFEEENDEVIVYVQYADGSKEKLETVLEPVFDEIDSLTEDLEDNG